MTVIRTLDIAAVILALAVLVGVIVGYIVFGWYVLQGGG